MIEPTASEQNPTTPYRLSDVIRPVAEALTEREARYADAAFQTWDGRGNLQGGTWGEVARAVIALADDEIEARVFDDFKHTLSAKDAIIAEQTAKVVEGEDLIEHLHGVMGMQTEVQTEALKAIGLLTDERDEARAMIERLTVQLVHWMDCYVKRGAMIERLTTEHKAAGIHAQESTDARYAAEAALDRVRALCSDAEDSRPWISVAELRAAIEGNS